MFEQSLSDKVPSAYVEGVTTKVVDGVTYTFTGWYTLPECYSNSKVDFATATMPASNLELYAGWDSQKETVYVYLTPGGRYGGENLGHHLWAECPDLPG